MSEEKMSFAEVRNALAGLVPMSSKSVYEFTPNLYDNVPLEYRPTFKIKQFNIAQTDKIKGIMTGTKKVKRTDEQINDIFMEMLFEIFEGWDNLYDLGTGESFEYDRTIESMKLLPQTILVKIFEEAIVISGVITRAQLASISGAMLQ